MNREIKFRIWDHEKKQFLTYPCYVNHLDGNEFMCFDRYFTVSEERCVLQQYTGRQDVNDKDIYEGDIVWLDYAHCSPEYEKQNNIFEIIFHRGAFQLNPIKLSKPQGYGISGGNFAFRHMVEIIGHDDEDIPIYKYHLPPPRPLCDFSVCVVMGNVFENPELL